MTRKTNIQEPYDPVLGETKQAAIIIAKKLRFEELFCDAMNCEFRDSAKTMKGLEDFRVTLLPHPAYSPDSSLATAGLCDRAQV
jgi:hypothetical protein